MRKKIGRPEEQEAVNTTIVGGRPPGCGKPVGNIPRGIEILIKKAAVDPEFKELLLAEKAKAADEIDLKLDAAEAMMLKAVPQKQLEGIIDNTVVPPKQRSAFMGKVAAAMLAAIGVAALAGCPAPSEGIRPDNPDKKQNVGEPKPAGITSDRSEGAEKKPASETPEPPSPGARPARPERVEPTDGIRPDQPVINFGLPLERPDEKE